MESTVVSEQLNLILRKRKWTEIPFNLQPHNVHRFFTADKKKTADIYKKTVSTVHITQSLKSQKKNLTSSTKL